MLRTTPICSEIEIGLVTLLFLIFEFKYSNNTRLEVFKFQRHIIFILYKIVHKIVWGNLAVFLWLKGLSKLRWENWDFGQFLMMIFGRAPKNWPKSQFFRVPAHVNHDINTIHSNLI